MSSDLQSDGDLDSIRNSCDVFEKCNIRSPVQNVRHLKPLSRSE